MPWIRKQFRIQGITAFDHQYRSSAPAGADLWPDLDLYRSGQKLGHLYQLCDSAVIKDNVATISAINDLASRVIGAAIEVHKVLGPGLLESSYEECLCFELSLQSIDYERQKHLPIIYKNAKLDCSYRLDVVVQNQIILELKSCQAIEEIHKAQLLTYLKLSGLKLGLILNFNVPVLKDGIVRLVNNLGK